MILPQTTADNLLAMKEQLDRREEKILSPLATLSGSSVRRSPDAVPDHRQAFATDTDRILHSRAYTRYIDKTQVFYMIANDHITHRVLHVQLVSKVARTIGRFLGLNEDLIEAIALGHDIGHPPFGHDGEHLLDTLCKENGLSSFQHNLQSVRFLDSIERKGRGWNLTLQTLDGIMCHDGEIHNRKLTPQRNKTFADLDSQMLAKSQDIKFELVPMSLEGCVVRFSDTIAYIGRDIEDAIELGLIKREEIPKQCVALLGDTNGSIVYRLVTDLIANGIAEDCLSFSPDVSSALLELKEFNYERIYKNPLIKKGFDKVATCYRALFESLLENIEKEQDQAPVFSEFLLDQEPPYKENNSPAAMVRDFIAGMTDDYFINQARILGCDVPKKS